MAHAQRNGRDGFAAVPANAWLGMRLVGMEAGRSEVALEPRPEFTQEAGVPFTYINFDR